MAMIRKINEENNNEYIIEDIDDRTCLVRENRVEEIKAKVMDIMQRAMATNQQMMMDDDDIDSDLD